MILSNQCFQEKLFAPDAIETISTYKLLSKTAMVHFPYSGVPLFLPIGHAILNSVKKTIEKYFEFYGFSQIYAPLIQHDSFMKSSGRHEQVKNELFYLQNKFNSFYLTPTNEEFFLNLLDGNLSYRNLPIRFFQIADKFRNIKKPKEILRSKQFLMCDAVSIDASETSLMASAQLFEQCVAKVFAELGINSVRCHKNNGKYVDFLILCPEGETNLQLSAQGDYEFAQQQTEYSASSLAMYFIFDCQELLPTFFTDAEGGKKTVNMGTYGFGIQRCIHAIVHQHRDSLGINFPASVRPFNFAVLPIDPKSDTQRDKASQIYGLLHEQGCKPVLDDRRAVGLRQRAAFSDFLGIPTKLLIGDNEIKTGKIMVKSRNSTAVHMIAESDLLHSLELIQQQPV